jgi:hypothetical protein
MHMSLLPEAPHVAIPAPRSRRQTIRWALSRIRGYSRGVQAPPAGQTEQALYGFAQPILGVRVLLTDPELLKEALYPAGLLAAACALYATFGSEAHGHWGIWFKHFYKAFAALAPLPSFFFANHYARLAAMIRWRLGFGACGPREMPWGMLLGRMIRQALIVAVGIAPVVALAHVIPGLGNLLSGAALAIWSLHWVVADAFDDAQVCLPGESVRDSVQRDRMAPQPWFVRWTNRFAARLPGILGAPVRWFAKLCDKLALDSRGEIATMESNRPIALGFSLSTAALLATPVLNLLFRPIIIAGSTHLLGQLEREEHPQLSAAETPVSALAR